MYLEIETSHSLDGGVVFFAVCLSLLEGHHPIGDMYVFFSNINVIEKTFMHESRSGVRVSAVV
jgi:hypothetical protein